VNRYRENKNEKCGFLKGILLSCALRVPSVARKTKIPEASAVCALLAGNHCRTLLRFRNCTVHKVLLHVVFCNFKLTAFV
jgi:hypothetical protein